MGGMAAFIPIRRDEEVNDRAIAKVREDKEREAGDGHDGTWVAHPDLVPVAHGGVRRACWASTPTRSARSATTFRSSAADLLDYAGRGRRRHRRRRPAQRRRRASATWQPGCGGNGAAAIYNLMEDAATAEISRSQLWQWVHHGAVLDDGRVGHPRPRSGHRRRGAGVDPGRARRRRPTRPDGGEEARRLFEQVALADELRRVPDPARLRRTRRRPMTDRSRCRQSADQPGRTR